MTRETDISRRKLKNKLYEEGKESLGLIYSGGPSEGLYEKERSILKKRARTLGLRLFQVIEDY